MTESARDEGDGARDGDEIAVALARLGQSWRGLTEALEGIPEERLAEPGAVGTWSVKDVMGHVAFWDEQALLAAERHLAGQPPVRVPDWDGMNERQAAARADRSVAEQRAEMERAHELIVALLESRPPLDPAAVGLCGCLEEDTYQHYDEHARNVRAWRERVGV
ncbi:MAG: DinB family protein [Chloroflexota bacterium]|nr:DinB family protein [Chloroflexota bacterium]